MLYIYLFGHLRLFHHKQLIEFNARPKTLELWVLLLLKRKDPIPRDSLAFLLWPDSPESTARADLRRHLYHLERALPEPLDNQGWLIRKGDTIQWNPDSAYWLDVGEFDRLSALPDYLEKAASLYTNDLLVDLYDDWLEEERGRLRAKYLGIMHHLIAQQQAAGDLDRALVFADEVLRRDPLDESFVQALMRLQYEAGDTTRALKTYEMFRVRLSDELAADPTQETTALYETIASGKPYPVAQSHPGSINEGKHNLRAALTSFFGRERELASLHEMLALPSSPVRLITLVGPPGTGKTRLALEAANRLRSRQLSTFPDGIYFVDLSAVTDASLVIPAVAKVLGIKQNPDQPLTEQLQEYLKSQYVLLILDNFEQVLVAAEEVVDLLAAAPALRVLVTSREPLKLYAEHEFPVAPLPYPDGEHLPEPAAMLDFGAVALFEARARQRQPDFALTDANAAQVARICHDLDGLPLAVELAAGQIRELSVSTILEQLQESRLSLASDRRDLPPRHQTLQAAIQWSYNLLAQDEKQLLCQLAVFAGGWTLEAAKAVCDLLEDRQIADSLTLLEDKNLIQRADSEATARWRMLATIREYALDQLDRSLEALTVRKRYIDYFCEFVQNANKDWFGPERAEIFKRLLVEDSNLEASLSYAFREVSDKPQDSSAWMVNSGAQLALSLMNYWRMQGRNNDKSGWHTLLLDHKELLPLELRIRLHTILAIQFESEGNLEAAKAQFEEALAVARHFNNTYFLAQALGNVGYIASKLGNLAEAKQLYTEVLSFAHEIEDDNARGDILTYARGNLGWVLTYQKEYAEAIPLLEANLSDARELGDPERIATGLQLVGTLCVNLKDYEKARQYFCESLQIVYEIHHSGSLICDLLCDLAGVYTMQGHHDERSSRLFGFTQAMRLELNHSPSAQFQAEIEHNIAELSKRQPLKMKSLLAEGAAMTLDEAVAYALQTA